MGHKEYVEKTEDPSTLIRCQFEFPDGDLCEALEGHDIHHLTTQKGFHRFIPPNHQPTVSLEGM